MKDYKSFWVRMFAASIDSLGSLFFFWIKEKKINPNIKKILILKMDRLGDSFLSTPAVEAIRKTFPYAEINLLCSRLNFSIFDGNPFLDNVFVFDGVDDVYHSSVWDFLSLSKIRRLTGEIKKYSPEMAVDLEESPLNVLAMFFAGVLIRVGFKNKLFSFLLNKKAETSSSLHKRDVYFSPARVLGYKEPPLKAKLYPDARSEKLTDDFIKKEKLVRFVVFHTTAGGSYKQWPRENFIQLAGKILRRFGDFKIVIIGAKKEGDFLSKIISDVGDSRCVCFLSDDIRATYLLIKKAFLFVGNDSSPMHLAAALDVPMIALMNKWVDIKRWKPLSNRAIIMESKNIHQCRGVGCHLVPCPNLAAITPNEVYEEVTKLIND